MLDGDHQVVAVQRVVSPTDCTVSQSTINGGPEGGDGRPSATLISMPAMVGAHCPISCSLHRHVILLQIGGFPAFWWRQISEISVNG